ncbi:MAG: sensor histidine kinase [Gammaproteobacteria bacterium]|nr:sensor histidine kinase [Gammaproteobacteria bacterium]
MSPPPDAGATMDALAITPAPHLVFRLDKRGRVIDFEDVLALDSFTGTVPECGADVHRCLHPTCRDIACKMRLCLHEGLSRIESTRIVEWELGDGLPGRTVRMHLRRAPHWASTWATLTITDITEGRNTTLALREVNRVLTEMNQRRSVGQLAEMNRLDRKLRSLTADLIVAQEKERQRISSELHDGVGQWLSIAKLALESALHRFHEKEGRQDAERALQNLITGIGEVRSIARNLAPSTLEQFGLVSTVELICHELQVSRPELNLLWEIDGEQGRIAVPLQIAIVRILQEATNNAAKHSAASSLQVSLRFQEESVVLVVEDNGRGFAVEGVSQEPGRGGLGLASMRERVLQTGGRLRITSRPGEGVRVHVTWARRTADLARSGAYKTIHDGIAGDGGSAL